MDAFWQAAADGLNHLGELGDQEGAEEDGDGEGGEEEEAGVDEGDADAGPDFAGAGEVGGLALLGQRLALGQSVLDGCLLGLGFGLQLRPPEFSFLLEFASF